MDLHYDDPNAWIWRTRGYCSIAHHHPVSSILVPGFSSSDELKQWYSDFLPKRAAANWDNTSKTCRSTAMLTSELSPDGNLTSGVQEGSHFGASKTGPATRRKSMSDMFKYVKNTVRRCFVACTQGRGYRVLKQ